MKEEFKAHVLLAGAGGETRSYLCRKPVGSELWFGVIAAPGVLIFYGDLGEIMFRRPGCKDMISWLKSAIRSTGYLLEKVPQEMQASLREFDEKGAASFVRDHLDNLEGRDLDNAQTLLEDLDREECPVTECSWTTHDFLCASRFLWEGEDPPCCERLKESTLWKIAALEKFCEVHSAWEKLSAEEKAKVDEITGHDC